MEERKRYLFDDWYTLLGFQLTGVAKLEVEDGDFEADQRVSL